MEESDQIIVPKKVQSNRSIFTDWMRSMGIYLVVFVHIFVSLGNKKKLIIIIKKNRQNS